MKTENLTPRATLTLDAQPARLIRHVDERLMSYNIEMTEVTGGTFWKAYTPEQIAGTAEFPAVTGLEDVTAMPELMEYYPPIDLYNERLRTLNELGGFCTITNGVIFHNTLASSDYGFLEHGSFTPRPNYFAVLLWNRLIGTRVYDCTALQGENCHVYCHSRRDGAEGVTYLVINNSPTDPLDVVLPGDAICYTLHARSLRSPVMLLNGQELTLPDTGDIPELIPRLQPQGTVRLEPGSCTFFVL